MNQDIEVFECVSGVSKAGNAYNIGLVRIGDSVGKIFSDVALPTGKLTVEIATKANREMFLGPRITKIVTK